MNNIFDRKLKSDIEPKKVIHSSDILPRTIKQRHIDGVVLFVGDSADLPDGTTEVKMYYEEDTKKLKIWNSTTEDWDETTLS